MCVYVCSVCKGKEKPTGHNPMEKYLSPDFEMEANINKDSKVFWLRYFLLSFLNGNGAKFLS